MIHCCHLIINNKKIALQLIFHLRGDVSFDLWFCSFLSKHITFGAGVSFMEDISCNVEKLRCLVLSERF